MNTLLRAAAGASMGVLATSGILIAWLLFVAGVWGAEAWQVVLGIVSIIPVVVALAGPGAAVFGLLHAIQMGRIARQCRTARAIRVIGVLSGLALGVATLLLTVALYQLSARFTQRFNNLAEVLGSWLIPALAGGAGLGWGGTFGLEPGLADSQEVMR